MKERHDSRGGRLRLLPVLTLFALLLSTSATAATSYLQELEAEGTSSPAATTETPKWSTQQPLTSNETVKQGLTKPQFEEALKSRFYGSYLFYATLSNSKQLVVYEEYQKNNDIEHLREVIKAQLTN